MAQYNSKRAGGINDLVDKLQSSTGRQALWDQYGDFVKGAAAGYLLYKVFERR